ncbi:hypothetical protein AGENTSMITH_87 [Bacillus phage vB_BspM_AgentSmith]|nr:hypothetical protein AGENTSMITH_87 [Bacillus phage vB_BspM_AgentSmith]
MNNFSKFCAGVIAGVVIVVMSQLNAQDNSRLEKVQSGELTLTCHLPQGIVDIEKELVTGYDGEMWKFENGSAKSCWTN